jgi:predicted DNA-binding protein
MAAVKVTFTLDQATTSRLQEAAQRLALPKSEVVREAIREFYEKIGRLSDSERLRMLRTFDEVVPRIPTRSLREVERELEDIRHARRSGGRRSSTKRKS